MLLGELPCSLRVPFPLPLNTSTCWGIYKSVRTSLPSYILFPAQHQDISIHFVIRWDLPEAWKPIWSGSGACYMKCLLKNKIRNCYVKTLEFLPAFSGLNWRKFTGKCCNFWLIFSAFFKEGHWLWKSKKSDRYRSELTASAELTVVWSTLQEHIDVKVKFSQQYVFVQSVLHTSWDNLIWWICFIMPG